MNRSIAAVGLAALVGVAGVGASAPAQGGPAPKASQVERFMKIRTPGAPTIGPDGTLYVRDWPDGIWQLYRVDGKEARPDGKMTALTSFHDGLAGYSLSEDGSKALLLHAVGGNENNQISLLDIKSGKTTPLLANPKVQHSVDLWLRDDSGFVYTANDESANDFYIYRYDFNKAGAATAGHGTKLLGKAGSWSAHDITQDTSRVLVTEFRSASDSSIYELEAKTGKLTDLTVKPDGGTVSIEPVGYMPGESSILFTSDIENGLKKLFLKDLKSGQVSKPISELEAFELDSAGMNREKTLLTAVTNEDGYGVLHVYRLPTFEVVELPKMDKGVVSVNELRGNHLVYTMNNAKTPGIAFAYDIPEKSGGAAAGALAGLGGVKGTPGVGAPVQITAADTQGIDFSKFGLPQLVKYKSFDGVEIPAFVFLPSNYFGAKKHPIPFVVYYHGGPEGQSRPIFDKTIQYLLSEGFGVIQPNVRGSSGYGRAFLMMDDYKKRWDSVKDGVAAAAWLVEQGYATPGKIATYGGSYGGFMSVACVVEDQQQVDAGARKERLFGAGIDVVGIVNMKTFLEQTSGYRRKLREVEYGPLSDPEFLDSVSSIKKIDKINIPMFIAHGFNDPRVPVGEAMQLANALKEKAVREKKLENLPHLFIAPDEGHGFQKLNNRLYFAEYMAGFLKQTIGEQGKEAAAK